MTTDRTRRRQARIRRIRTRLTGTTERPRLTIQRTARHFRAQLIDDATGRTLVSVDSVSQPSTRDRGTQQAAALGQLVTEQALAAGINQAVFDRRGYRYHGRVAAFAEAARQAGLIL